MGERVPGETAPSFRLSRLDGEGEIAGPSLGPLTLLLFVKASCPTCRWALPFFQTLHEGTREGSLRVLGIVQDDAETERALADELGLTFPLVREGAPWDTAEAYGLTTVPSFFVVDGQGQIVLTSSGFVRDDVLEVARRAAEHDGGSLVDPFVRDGKIPLLRPG